jgi:hypothetical protein
LSETERNKSSTKSASPAITASRIVISIKCK